MKTFASLFSGGGAADTGAAQAGYTPIWAIEYDAAIADVYGANLGRHVTCARVEDADPAEYDRPDVLWSSPPCPSFSVANANRGETEADRNMAKAVANFVRVLTPPVFLLENVPQYRHSGSLAIIEAALNELGYWTQVSVLNTADFGVPQTRKRLILRACRDGFPPPLPSPTPWIGWYQAIEDLIPALPPSQFALWQIKRLPAVLPEIFMSDMQNPSRELTIRDRQAPCPTVMATWFRRPVNIPKAFFLVEGDAAGERPPSVRRAEGPAFTLKTDSGGRVHRAFLIDCQNGGQANDTGERGLVIRHEDKPAFTLTATHNKRTVRAWLEQGRVVSMTPRALARFQSFPDSYVLPAKNALACRIIGNAVPCELARRLLIGLEAAV